MKPPKHLFRRGRLSDDHEAVAVGPPPDDRPLAHLDLSRHIVHVPVAAYVELDADHCLRGLEARGVRVDRSKGSSAIDVARNLRASDALRAGFDSLLFIDSDILFDPADAINLLLSDEPVIAGVYAAKKLGNGQVNAHFAEGTETIRFGEWASDRLYPVTAVGAGFLRIKTAVLRRLIDELKLPECRMADRYGWPFFMPLIVQEGGETRYLAEDYAFCARCRQAGIQPMVDTSIRLYHIGGYAYGWEEAGGDYVKRSRNLESAVALARPHASISS